jgi:hypothetical protein
MALSPAAPIEQACKTNIMVKILARDAEPDHDTIAHFISSRAQAVKDLFSQVLFECHAPGLIGGELFAIDGCKPPSNASKEWFGTMAELGKKPADWTRPMERIVGRRLQPDREGKVKSGLNATAASYVYEEQYRKRHVERPEKKPAILQRFLEGAKSRIGAGGEELKSNITDNESAPLKGTHGYVRGYNGIGIADGANQVMVAAEAYGSGSESGHFPDKPDETMQRLAGNKEPLFDAIVEGDTGYFSDSLPGGNAMEEKDDLRQQILSIIKKRIATGVPGRKNYPTKGTWSRTETAGKHIGRGAPSARCANWGSVHSRAERKESETDAVYNGQIEGRKSRQSDEEENRRGEIQGVVGEADADNRAVLCGHEA